MARSNQLLEQRKRTSYLKSIPTTKGLLAMAKAKNFVAKLTPEQERQEHYRKMAADRVKVNAFVPHVDQLKLDRYHARPL